MSTVLLIAGAMMVVSFLIGLGSLVRAPDRAGRAVVGDLLLFAGIGLLVVFGIMEESAAVLDAALLASLLGVLATIAFARIVTRGKR